MMTNNTVLELLLRGLDQDDRRRTIRAIDENRIRELEELEAADEETAGSRCSTSTGPRSAPPRLPGGPTCPR